MAFIPCSAGLHAHRGRNATFYFHQWNPTRQDDRRLRLCRTHLAQAENDLAKFEVITTDDATGTVGAPVECMACLKPVTELDWHLALTGYPANNDRKDYWARLHVDCRLPAWAIGGESLNQV